MAHVPNTAPKHVLSFVRAKGDEKVFAVFNLSKEPQTVNFKEPLFIGEYKEALSGKTVNFTNDTTLSLPAWGFKVFEK